LFAASAEPIAKKSPTKIAIPAKKRDGMMEEREDEKI
jgi:hypothetical protein